MVTIECNSVNKKLTYYSYLIFAAVETFSLIWAEMVIADDRYLNYSLQSC